MAETRERGGGRPWRRRGGSAWPSRGRGERERAEEGRINKQGREVGQKLDTGSGRGDTTEKGDHQIWSLVESGEIIIIIIIIVFFLGWGVGGMEPQIFKSDPICQEDRPSYYSE